MGVWYSWLTHLPCTQESPVRIWVPPLCNDSETNDGTAVTKLIKKTKWNYKIYVNELWD